jgi:Ca2+-binding RTX toxin-like protein
MIIKISATDQVTVKDWFGADANQQQGFNEIENLLFADGTLWNREKLKTLVPAFYNATVNADTINGWDGIDRINGMAGNDTLVGGMGDDTYILDTAADIVVENTDEGIDTVQIGATYTLGSNVENLVLTGANAINGTGNTLDNVLTGNSGVNVLTGGAGNDTYWLGRGYGLDTIIENDSAAGNTDVARFDAGIAADQLWFTKAGNNLNVSIIGTADKFTLSNWYLGNQYHVEQFKTSDGKTLLDSKVQNAFAPPVAGQTTLSTAYANTLNPVIAANWQ